MASDRLTRTKTKFHDPVELKKTPHCSSLRPTCPMNRQDHFPRSHRESFPLARFDDYHRTVVGYHGTGLSTALRVVNRIDRFRWSQRDFDWLGHGIFFWKYAPEQALAFAKLRQQQFRRKTNPSPEDRRRAEEPLAVVASMIRLGFCFDLLDPENVEYLLEIFADYKQMMASEGAPLPVNTRKYRKLDCSVFEYAYQVINASQPGVSVDTIRGVYVPASGERRIWDRSWISRGAHIQLCVRNPMNLLGCWLHFPERLEAEDVEKALRNAPLGFQTEDRSRQSLSENDEQV